MTAAVTVKCRPTAATGIDALIVGGPVRPGDRTTPQALAAARDLIARHGHARRTDLGGPDTGYTVHGAIYEALGIRSNHTTLAETPTRTWDVSYSCLVYVARRLGAAGHHQPFTVVATFSETCDDTAAAVALLRGAWRAAFSDANRYPKVVAG